jgi:hypothetical protein
VVFDTGSDWFVLEADLCSNCIAPFYRTEESKTVVFDSSNSRSIDYGSASLTGSDATDMIAVNIHTSIATAIKDFRWFAVKTQRGFKQTFDGMLGLARSSSGAAELKIDELKN